MNVESKAQEVWATVVDGTTMKGRTFIGNTIIGNEPQWSRHTGSTAWCGYFARYVHNQCGMLWVLANQFASWYRAINLYGQYRDDPNLKPPLRVEFQDGHILTIRDWHTAEGQVRLCLPVVRGYWPRGYVEAPGDLLIRTRRLTSWHGHVMLLSSIEGATLYTIEGNAKGILGNGKWGYGVVRGKRTWKDIDYIIRPSALDWRTDVRYMR